MVNIGDGSGKHPTPAASRKTDAGRSLFLNARPASRHSSRGCLTITKIKTMANCPGADLRFAP